MCKQTCEIEGDLFLFNIFKSNKMENLMDAFASVLHPVPDDALMDPMAAEWIGIQSRGMKQWISIQMAQKLGICANTRFVFPRQMIDMILSSVESLENQDESMGEDFFFWSIFKSLNESDVSKEFSSIQNYIKGDETGQKRYQLSMKIAKVFDDYQVYRPDMLINWQKIQSFKKLKDPVEQWQASLWRKVVSKYPQNHLAVKADLFLKAFSSKTIKMDNLPSRMSFFGISALPGLFLQVFEKMSQLMDINLFLLIPSDQFFFDIKSARQIGRMAVKKKAPIDPGPLYYEMANPLLSSLGTSGKAFLSSLEAYNYHEPFDDLFQDIGKESETMLAILQSDILNLVHRKKGGQEPLVTITDQEDTSICIHACHSPMREAQVLKDLLLNEFENDPELDPHDIIVMMPDIEAYAPFVESVFTLETTLPFSISDRRKRSESEPLDAFLKILALKNSRLEQRQVLDLLLSESIAQTFNISFDEISMIEKMVTDANIFWGRDSDHRESLELPAFEENTWQFGLQRLFMGMAMPENHDIPVQDILPCESFEGLDLEVLGKFSFFCHTLFSCFKILTGQKTIEKWCNALKKISNSLMDRNLKNGEDVSFLFQTIDQIREDAQRAGFIAAVSFETMGSLIEQKLDQNFSQGNFLAGNITFCNIMPMRSIPFKIVVLMGMDEKSFPRQVFKPGFDLIKKFPRPGDKIERDEDRYLFLETLLSVRSKLIITYTGMSIQDNSIIPCSGVVSELMDTMDESFVFSQGVTYRFFHPLHPFNSEYFNIDNPDRDSLLYSFSKDNCSIAKALCEKKSDKSVFFKTSPETKLKEQKSNILLDEMIRFFRNPIKWSMKERLNIKLPQLEEQQKDREAFSLSGLDQYALGSFLMEKNIRSSREIELYPTLKAMGSLPLGEKGRFEYEKMVKTAEPVINAARDIALKKQLSPVALSINISGLEVLANFSDIREDGVYILNYGKLNGARLLSAWIRHLFFNICAPKNYPKKTILIGRDPKGKKSLLTHLFPVLDSDALQYFKELVQFFINGGAKPFYFSCETSWQFVQALVKKGVEPDGGELDRDMVFAAMNRSKTSWYGGYYQTGERDNRYVSLGVENNDPFESVDAMLSSGFAQNSLNVYYPLLKNLETLS